MSEHSKHYQTFINKTLHMSADIELIDIINVSLKKGALGSCESTLFDEIKKDKHPILSKRATKKMNQTIAMNHLRQTVFSSYIKDLYEEVYEYLKSMLTEAALNTKVEPKRFIGEHIFEIKISEVLETDKLQKIIEDIVSKIFRKLENERSTSALIEKTCNKLDLNIDEIIKNTAIHFLEIRHQLVHADGKADEQFKKTHPDLNYTKGNYIDLRYKLIKKFRKAIIVFIEEFDINALEKGLVTANE